MESTARESRRHLSELRSEQSEVSVHLREHEVGLDNLRERTVERYQVRIELALADYVDGLRSEFFIDEKN